MKTLKFLPLSSANGMLVLAVFVAVVMNFPVYGDIYHNLHFIQHYNLAFIVVMPLIMVLALNIFFNLLNWPYITRPLLAVILVISSFVSYAQFSHGVAFDESQITSLFQGLGWHVFNWGVGLALWFIVFGFLPAWLVIRWPLKQESLIEFGMRKMLYMIASAVIILFLSIFFYPNMATTTLHSHYVSQRIVPIAWLHNSMRYLDGASAQSHP